MKPEEKKAATPGPAGLKGAGPAILQVIPNMDSGGAEKSVVEITAALSRARARSLLASGPGRLISAFEAAGGTWFPLKAGTKNPVRMVLNAFRLAGLIRRENVTLIHARSRAPAWSALMAARMTGIAFVTTNHGAHSYTGRLKRLYNSVMARGDMVIANSQFTAGRLRHYHHVEEARLRVVPRGVDLGAYDRDKIDRQRLFSLREAWGLEASPARIVLLPARLSPRKGHETVIEAARLLPKELLEQIVILFIGAAQGRNDHTRRIAQAIENAGLGGHIRLAGHCTDMAAAYALADLVLVPSTEPEAFGRVAAEAQAMGVPVIASDLGAVSETVLAPPDVAEEERTGWRVPAGDTAALAEAMQDALSLGDAARAGLVRRGKNYVGKHFSLARMTEGTLTVYDDLLGSNLAGGVGADPAKG